MALQQAGYKTGLVGEYLDGYGQTVADSEAGVAATYIPPGWDSWDALSGDYAYSGYTINQDGTLVHPTNYLTDELASRAISFLTDGDAKPHFLWLAPLAVRLPAEPAKRDAEADVNASVPKGEQDVSDKPSFLRQPPIEKQDKRLELQTTRLRTLLSVEDLLNRVLAATDANTVVIVTSDSGYRLGKNGLHTGNGTAYDPDIRVPLVIQGPSSSLQGATDDRLAANIDLAPTIAGLAGVSLLAPADGLDLLAADRPSRDAILIEHEAAGKIPVFNAVRTQDGWTYVEWANGTVELYSLAQEPGQGVNLAAEKDAAATYGERMTRMSAQLHQLMECAGDGCT